MNLVIDIGNSFIKTAVFDSGKMVCDDIFDASEYVQKIQHLFNAYPKITHAMVCAVGEFTHQQLEVLSLYCKVLQLGHQTKLPFENRYASPETLGVDRMALVSAAFYQYHGNNTLIIDAGSCITYDFLSDKGVYLGGAIAPGLQMRYKAMHQQTHKLPLLEAKPPEDLIGDQTAAAMHSGVFFGVVDEVDGAIKRYQDRFELLTVILTGGDAQFFGKRLKNSIFAHSKFLLEGLNSLLEYNKQ